MKKLFIIYAFISVLFSCNNGSEPKQDYTSFVVKNNAGYTYKNCIAGYFDSLGICRKIADLGTLEKNAISPEIIILNDTLKYVYLWLDIPTTGQPRTSIVDTVYVLENFKKKSFVLIEGFRTDEVSMNDIYNYPH
jgi:hypothetical protein